SPMRFGGRSGEHIDSSLFEHVLHFVSGRYTLGMAFSASWLVPPACGTCCFAPKICSLLPSWLGLDLLRIWFGPSSRNRATPTPSLADKLDFEISRFLGRFARSARFVTSRQTFVRCCQHCVGWAAGHHATSANSPALQRQKPAMFAQMPLYRHFTGAVCTTCSDGPLCFIQLQRALHSGLLVASRLSNSSDILFHASSDPPPPWIACCAHQVQNFDLSQRFWCRA